MEYQVSMWVLCASFFGVPQRRWRIFIVGARIGCPLPLPPQPTHYIDGQLRAPGLPGDWNNLAVMPVINFQTQKDVRNTENQDNEVSFSSDEEDEHPEEEKSGDTHGMRNNHGDNKNTTLLKPEVNVYQAIGDLLFYENDEAYVNNKNYGSPPFSEYQKMVRKNQKFCSQHWGRQLSKKGLKKVSSPIPEHRARVRWDKPFATICCSFNGKTSYMHPTATRYLSLRECARAQSFPDDVSFFGSLGSVYSQIGNAVPPLLGKALGLVFVNLDKNISSKEAGADKSTTKDKSRNK